MEVTCYSLPLALDDYVTSIGDPQKVVDMLVGNTQRIAAYAERGFAIAQPMPAEVRAAFVVAAGYVSCLV